MATIDATRVARTLKAGSTTITATRGALSGSRTLSVFELFDRLELAPATPTRTVGQTLQFTATAVGAGGQRFDRTSVATWTSTVPSVATVSDTAPTKGLATLLAPGTITIRATVRVSPFQTVESTTTLTVLPPLTAITVPPGAWATGVGQTLQLQALGTFADRSLWDLTGVVTWASSNAAVASITPGGLVTTVGQGVAALTATWGGITGTLTLAVFTAPPTVTITPPASGAIITGDRVIVRGTVTSTVAERGVLVNGRAALVSGNDWAVEVPLDPGGNAIVATALDATDAYATTSISVSAPNATPAPLLLQGIPETGIAPLVVRWEAINRTGRTLVDFQFDPGTGTFGSPQPTFEGVTSTHTGQGLVFSRLRARDRDDPSQTYEATAIVNVLDRTQIDAVLRAKWNAMKAALMASDIEGALRYFAESEQPRYRAIFTALSAQIARDMQDIQLIYLVEGRAKYRIRRTMLYGGQTETLTFYIYFGQDAAGVWRVGGF